MKTLKKVLCLVLALVMVVGTMAISAAAFDDDDEINAKYAKAVAVLAANKVIDGYDNGNFGPKDTLTRAQGIAIVARAILARKVADNLNASASPFADVSQDWQKGVIAYGVKEGMVAGYGNGNFGPADALTGYAFAKFLLTAMGVEGEYTGNNWENNVLLAANDIKLLDGMEDGFKLADPITREQAAQLAFNAAAADKLTSKTGTYDVKDGDTVVKSELPSYTDAYNIAKEKNDEASSKVPNAGSWQYDATKATTDEVIRAAKSLEAWAADYKTCVTDGNMTDKQYADYQKANSLKTPTTADHNDLVAAVKAEMAADAKEAAKTFVVVEHEAEIGKSFKGVSYTTSATADYDEFGRSSVATSVGDKVVYTAAATPVVTFENEVVSMAKLAADLKAPAKTDANGVATGKTPITFTVKTDGHAAGRIVAYKNSVDSGAAYLGGFGSTVEVYGSKTAYTVIVINSYAYKLTEGDITAGKAATATKAAVARTVDIDGIEYETDDFAKDDVVLYTKGVDEDGADVIVSAEKINSTLATVSKVSTSSGVTTVKTADGSYKINVTLGTPIVASAIPCNLFFDSFGNIVYVDGLSYVPNFAKVIDVGYNSTGNMASTANTTYLATLLKPDGTTETVSLAADSLKAIVSGSANDAAAYSTLDAAVKANNFMTLPVVVYAKGANDKYTLATNRAIVNVTGATIAKNNVSIGGDNFANSKTIFVVKRALSTTPVTYKYDVYTGISNVPSLSGTVNYQAVIGDGHYASIVYVDTATNSGTASSNVVFVPGIGADFSSEATVAGGTNYSAKLNAIVNGSVEEIIVDATDMTTVATGVSSKYTMFVDGTTVVDDEVTGLGNAISGTGINVAAKQTSYEKTENGVLTLGSDKVVYNENTKLFLVDADGEINAITAESLSAHTVADVYYYTTNNVATVVVIMNVVAD